MTIDPTSAVTGASSIGSIGSIGSITKPPTATEGGSGFGSMLSDAIQGLADSQTQAAQASQAGR